MIALVAAISSVWPSPAAAITGRVPISPPPPERFSTMTVWPHMRRELLAHGAGQDVGAAAGRGRHHDADQRAGESLREGGGGGGGEQR